MCVVESIDKYEKVVQISYHSFDGEQFLEDIFPVTNFLGTIFPETIFPGTFFHDPTCIKL